LTFNKKEHHTLLKSIIFIFGLCFLSFAVQGQQLSLKVKAKKKAGQRVIDSLKYQKGFESFNTLSEEVSNLNSRLIKSGFIDCKTDSLERKSDSLILAHFRLGQKVDSISLLYAQKNIAEKWVQYLSQDHTDSSFVIPFSKLEESLSYLSSKIADQGRPFSTVSLKQIGRKDNTLIARLISTRSQRRKIDSIVVKGYDKFPRAYLKNYLGLKTGKPFNKTEIDRKLGRLGNLRFAQSKRSPEVLFRQDSTAIYLYLERRDSNRFDGFLGFSTSEESSGLELNGYINLQLNNNLNFGEEFSIQYRNTGDEQERIQVELELPFLFDTPFGLNLGLDIYRRDSTFTTTDQFAKLTYQLTSNLKLNAGYRGSSSTANANNVILGQNAEDFEAGFFSTGANFMIINDYNSIIPVNTDLNFDINIGKRTAQNQPEPQYRLFFEGFHSVQLNARNSIYIKNQSGYLNSETFLTNELFRFGGINSLRGFEENSLISSLYSSFQTEYRYLISRNLYAHSIVDFAYAENAQLNDAQRLFSFGFGFGLKTKAGLLRVNIANGKSEGQKLEFNNTKVHLSLTSIF
jgi:outer membrane protein assembly factor BamA